MTGSDNRSGARPSQPPMTKACWCIIDAMGAGHADCVGATNVSPSLISSGVRVPPRRKAVTGKRRDIIARDAAKAQKCTGIKTAKGKAPPAHHALVHGFCAAAPGVIDEPAPEEPRAWRRAKLGGLRSAAGTSLPASPPSERRERRRQEECRCR